MPRNRLRSRPAREAAEVGRAVLLEGVAPLLALFAHIEEHGGIACELLETGQAVVGGVQSTLQHPQCQRRQRQHLATPGHRLSL